VRVVIAEDSVLLQAGLAKVLETLGFEIVATVADADGLLASVERQQPDVAIIDVRMPPGHSDEGVRAALVIRRQWPRVGVLLLSQYVEERYAAELLSSSTSGVGYLLKQRVANVEEFAESVRRVAAGGTALDPDVVSQLLLRRAPSPLDRLTTREREVLGLMAEGRSNPAIAGILVVSEGTVAKHINNIFTKLASWPRSTCGSQTWPSPPRNTPTSNSATSACNSTTSGTRPSPPRRSSTRPSSPLSCKHSARGPAATSAERDRQRERGSACGGRRAVSAPHPGVGDVIDVG
jgi:DNA-binding NarL/FixJ family response regulator